MANVSALSLASAIPSQIGRYKIVCELGQGGMGTIYLGRAEGIGGFERLMAIKMIHPHLSRQQSFINMFLDEARIAALIRHPNVVPVYEIGEHFGRHFIAMDYVSGEPLSTLLDNTWCRGIPLDFDVVAYIISVVCEALHAAHDLKDPVGRPLKVVHRDVCPQNIMLGYDGVTRVMDFGVAKAVDQLSQTRPGTHKGKVPYMAPEQIRCQPVDRRSDIFSLGVVLWESTIGKRLFKAENDILSASKVLKGKVPRPSKARESYPLELEAIVLKALNPRAEKRYQTAREMGQALREYLAHRASLVSPSDLESLLKSVCKARFERRMEMERRAANQPPDAGPIEEETIQLFAAGESALPSFDVEVALQPLDEAKDALMSAITTREVYEYTDELDDATVRTQLEELGFLATAEFDLLEEDREAPKTVIEDVVSTEDLDPSRKRKSDTSAIRELVAESDAAISRSTHDALTQLLADESRADGARTKPPLIERLPDDLSEPEAQEREVTPLLKLDLVGGRKGIFLLGASLAVAALVAVALGISQQTETPPAERTKAVTAEKRPAPPPLQLEAPEVSPLPASSLERPSVALPEPKLEPKLEPKHRPAVKVGKRVVKEAPPAPGEREREPAEEREPPKAKLVEMPVEAIALEAELHEREKPKIAKRAKHRKKRARDQKAKLEKKKAAQKQERVLVGADDL